MPVQVFPFPWTGFSYLFRECAQPAQAFAQLIRIAGVRQSHKPPSFLAECLAGRHGGAGNEWQKARWKSDSFLAVAEIICFVQKRRFEIICFVQNQAFEIVCFVHLVS